MTYGNLDKMKQSWLNRQDPETCEHDYDPMVGPMGMLIEMCLKCFDTKGIVDLS
jgi:hypothetical protein